MARYAGDLQQLWSKFDANGDGVLQVSEGLALTKYFLSAMKDLMAEVPALAPTSVQNVRVGHENRPRPQRRFFFR